MADAHDDPPPYFPSADHEPTFRTILSRPPVPTPLAKGERTNGLGHATVSNRKPPPADAPGRLPAAVGRYTILGEVGCGGMGRVLRAHDPELDRTLAIKVLLGKHQDQPEFIRRFLEEARINGRLQHPGVVPVHELGRLADDRPFFTMKLVEGQTLAALLKGRQDAAADHDPLLAIFGQICQTIAYAHSRGVIHRDLKPANVMVGAFGEVQVMDWGLAKVLKGDAREEPPGTAGEPVTLAPAAGLSEAGAVLGTPAYMAPEQARGDVYALDERCDVFGLGAILCVLLTDEPPYTGLTSAQTYQKAVRGDLAEARARLERCAADPELVRLTLACLAVDPADRPRDGGVVARLVQAYQAGVRDKLRALELAGAATKARAAEERKRRWVLAGVVAFAAFMLICGLKQAESRHQYEHENAVGRRLAIDREVNGLMDQARDLRGKARDAAPNDLTASAAALAFARNAEQVAADGPPDLYVLDRLHTLVAELEREHKDRTMLAAIEEARVRHTQVRAGRFDREASAAGYAVAFAEYGIDLRQGDAAAVAALVGERAIRVELAAALDDWAILTGNAAEGARLEAIARLADPDPLRGQVRAARVRKDVAALRELAGSPNARELPSATLVLLGLILAERGAVEEARTLLRQAQQRHRDDFWINHTLAYVLHFCGSPALDEALRYYTAALAVRGQSPGLQLNYAMALNARGETKEAVAALREAIRLQPDYAEAYNDLGIILAAGNDLDGAVAQYREAIKYYKDYSRANLNLGNALRKKGDAAGAAAAYREVVRIAPDFPGGYVNLGLALKDANDLPGAAAAYRKALAMKPTAETYNSLGVVLKRAGDLKGAIAAFQDSIRLNPDYVMPWFNLGNAYDEVAEFDKAIAAYKEALRVKNDDPNIHNNLGIAYQDAKRYAEAAASYREAIRLRKGFYQSYVGLGGVLERQGQYAEAVAAWKRALEFAPPAERRRAEYEFLVRHGERLARLETRVPALLAGKETLTDAADLLALAGMCSVPRGHYAASARFAAAAFALDPKLAEDLSGSYRYTAAAAAVRAADGQGADAAALTDAARTGLRVQALAWLRADLADLTWLAADDIDRGGLRRRVDHWLQDVDFAAVHEPDALARLSEAERETWCSLWYYLDRLKVNLSVEEGK